jgi:prepilin-type N-terminal cleavage/methylation domain-containing protein
MITSTPKQASVPSTQSGFTIIECLLAIILVSILMVAIAPAIVFSVATRLQARRVELGTQAARAYIDGVRAGTIDAPTPILPALPKATSPNYAQKRKQFAESPAPTPGILTCPMGNQYCTTPPLSLYCVDLDGKPGCGSNSSKDLVVQAFRSAVPRRVGGQLDDGSKGYLLVVRVYRADGFAKAGDLKKMSDSGAKKAMTFAGGMGDPKAPLTELTTEIRTSKTDFESLCDRLGGKGCS